MHGSLVIIPAGIAALLLSGPLLEAQSLPPPQSVGEAMTHLTLTPDGGNAATSGVSAAPVPLPAPGVLGGRLPIQLGLTLGGYFDDNIFARPDGPGKRADFIWSIAPLVAWNSASLTGAAASVQLAYAPTILFYQDHDRRDTVNQSANAVFGYEGDRAGIVVTQSYTSAQEASADANRLIIETTAVTSAQLNYQLTGKTSLEATARQTFTGDDPGLRSIEWTLATYLNYQVTPKTYVGLGDVLGWVELQGPNQRYQQINGRVGYDPDAKLSFNMTGGVEFRETEGHGAAEVTPDFSLGAEYEPFEGTDLNLSAYRRYDYSGHFYGTDYLATGVSASASQRFARRFHITLAGTFQNAQYRDNFTDDPVPQAYDYFSIQPAIRYEAPEGYSFQIFYQYRQSLAQGGVASFNDNEAGFTASFTY